MHLGKTNQNKIRAYLTVNIMGSRLKIYALQYSRWNLSIFPGFFFRYTRNGLANKGHNMDTSTFSVEQLKKTYQQLAFAHQVLTQRQQFYIEETEIAQSSARMLTDLCNKLSVDIDAIEAASNEVPNV